MSLNRHIALVSTIVLLTISQASATAQCVRSTMGDDFWFAPMPPGVPMLIATGDSGTVVTASIPLWNISHTATIDATGVAVLGIENIFPGIYGLHLTGSIGTGSVHITSTSDIALFAANYSGASGDMTIVFPTSTLGCEYIAQTYISTLGGLDRCATIGIAAPYDSTYITLTSLDGGGYNDFFMLNAGQSYYLRSEPYGTLSGIEVSSNGKPFALFQGDELVFVPEECQSGDQIFEQATPVSQWGRRFVIVPPLMRTGGERVMITAAHNDCQIILDSIVIDTLDEGKTLEVEVSSEHSHLLEASSPVYVCMYFKGASCSDMIGDPSSVTIPPVEQGISGIRFMVYDTELTNNHFINISTLSEDTSSISLDGQSIASSFTALDSEYSYARIAIEDGSHSLNSTNGHFTAILYGLGNYESYATVAGMSTRTDNRLLVNGINATGTSDDSTITHVCDGDKVHLSVVNIDSLENSIIWIIDNTTIANQNSSIDLVLLPGMHTITAIADYCDTLNGRVFVLSDTVFEWVTVCDSQSYIVDSIAFSDSGLYYIPITDNNGCNYTKVLHLSVASSSFGQQTDSLCFNGIYQWHNQSLDTAGIYIDTLVAANGCDSVVTLTLNMIGEPDYSVTIVPDCRNGTYHISTNLASMGIMYSWTIDDTSSGWSQHGDTFFAHPIQTTNYILCVNYQCPFCDTITLVPLHHIRANLKVLPEAMNYDHLYVDAYDITHELHERQWIIDGIPQGDDSQHIRHYLSSDYDSVVVGLVADNGHCTDTATETIRLLKTAVWAPTAFTPNQETNAIFLIVGNQIMQQELYIYNRQGLLVFHTPDPTAGWDGTYQGILCSQGAYTWVLLYREMDAPQKQQRAVGTVTLLR